MYLYLCVCVCAVYILSDITALCFLAFGECTYLRMCTQEPAIELTGPGPK